MENWLTLSGNGMSPGSGWPAVAGMALLLLTGLYALLSIREVRLPAWLRLPSSTGLRARVGLTLFLAIILPGVSLLLMLAGNGGQRPAVYGILLGWFLATLMIALCLSVALAGSISRALAALGTEIRGFDPEVHQHVARSPDGEPREIGALFDELAQVFTQLAGTHGKLQRALRQGERLRRELINMLESRESEIRDGARELIQANAQLERLSRSDSLTGVANRRGLAEFLDRAWRAGLREQNPVSLLMIDIDHFQSYNDCNGSEKGNICLQAVANAISHVAGRATDLVARYGGEEFVVVLGNTALEGALQVGEQIRSSIEGLAIPHRASPGNPVITVSVGVTSSLPVRGAQADGVLEAVERALHAAKDQGRNRVGYSTIARTGLFQSLCITGDPDRRPS